MKLNASALLTLLQFADSAFPTGLYAHSHGLEGMVRRGIIGTPDEVETFLRNQVVMSLLPADGVALLEAHAYATEEGLPTVLEIDQLLYAMKLPQELRAASCQVGRRLLTEAAAFINDPAFVGYRTAIVESWAPGNSAVAFGVIARALRLPAEGALLAALHSHAISVLGAAMRLLPFSHTDAQAILRRLQPTIAGELESLRTRPWREMRSFTPQLDIHAEHHAWDDLRMFAS